MPTVAEPREDAMPGVEPLACSGAERAAMPGLAAASAIGLGEQLDLALLVAALQRVKTEPGSGDLDFITGLRGKKPHLFSDAQRARIRRCTWRYRIQLPAGLRPASNPDKQAGTCLQQTGGDHAAGEERGV